MEKLEMIVVLAIPVYFASLLLEAWLSSKNKKGYYNLKDSFGNLGTGIIMQLSDVFAKAPVLAAYLYFYENFNLLGRVGIDPWSLDFGTLQGALSWGAGFLLVDLVYYLVHRHSHEVNVMWAAHMVHHSSEHYNFSVALRQSTFQGFYSALYKLSLAFIGLPPLILLGSYGINLIYQFFLHTRYVGKLGILEKVFNTPSHHRVHHARQGKYLDCNYAGVFIIWDRLFGTFIEEKEEPKYGIYPRFQSYDPVRANLMPWAELWGYFWQAKGWDKWRVLFGSPLWLFEKFKKGKDLSIRDTGREADAMAFAFFGMSLGLALVVLFVPTLSMGMKIFLVLSALATLKLMGKRLDSLPSIARAPAPVDVSSSEASR